MRVWVTVTLGGVALIAVAVLALAGTGAYFALRRLEMRTATEAESRRALDAVRTRFGARPPLVEVLEGNLESIRINRLQTADVRRVETLHVMTWKAGEGELIRVEVPLWLMRFSTVNVASHLGIGPAHLRLTVHDIERYGPGIVFDYGPTGSDRVLVWVD
jgi:hypothetical protein